MTPLVVQTTAPMGYVARHPVHLDALLIGVEAKRRGLTPPTCLAEVVDVPIPIARSGCGRYYLASAAVTETVAHEVRHIQRRFPVTRALYFGDPKLRRINEKSGAMKAFRIPVERQHADGGLLTWWCVGERDGVRDLLSEVTHVGRRRAVGEGMLALTGERWSVEECAPWCDGFPVLGPDGEALRNLPPGVEGLGAHALRYGRYAPPYWLPDEEPIAAPVVRR